MIDSKGWVSAWGAGMLGEGLAGSVLIEPFPHQLEAEKKWIPTWRPSRPHGCVTADDLLKAHPEVLPVRPQVGIAPKISDAEILTLAVMGPLLGFDGERRWIRHARSHYRDMFPHIPGQSGNQQATADPNQCHVLAHLRAGIPMQRVHRRPVAGGLHPRRVRPLPRNRQALRPGRVGRLRVTSASHSRWLVGPASAHDHHPRRATNSAGAYQSQCR